MCSSAGTSPLYTLQSRLPQPVCWPLCTGHILCAGHCVLVTLCPLQPWLPHSIWWSPCVGHCGLCFLLKFTLMYLCINTWSLNWLFYFIWNYLLEKFKLLIIIIYIFQLNLPCFLWFLDLCFLNFFIIVQWRCTFCHPEYASVFRSHSYCHQVAGKSHSFQTGSAA